MTFRNHDGLRGDAEKYKNSERVIGVRQDKKEKKNRAIHIRKIAGDGTLSR